MDSDQLLNVEEAAAYLRFNPKTIRRLSLEGRLPGFKAGYVWRFRRSELDRWLENQTVEQRKLSVLVVDDEEIVCEMLRMLFQDAGFIPTITHNGREAVAVLENFTPDVIILDLKMPVMDGAETLKHIRERHGSIPVVILTGYADTDLMQRALEWAPFTVVRKPMKPEELIATVRAVAAGKILV